MRAMTRTAWLSGIALVVSSLGIGCSAPEDGDDGREPASAEAEQNEEKAAPRDHTVEGTLPYQASAELAMALAGEANVADVPQDVSVPGVLEIQHQYSIAAIGLYVRSWALVGGDDGMSVVFPGRAGVEPTPIHHDGEAAAKALFEAMVGAKETTSTNAGRATTTRTSERGTFSCDRFGAQHRCTVRGVAAVGGHGNFW